jgi:hypothetical protein
MNSRYVLASLVLTGGLLTGTAAMAWDQYPFDEYIQRSDKVFLGAGDDQDANTATHVIDPWPRYAGDRRIPGNGERMSGAVERYRKSKEGPKPIEPLLDVDSATGGGGNGGGGNGGGGGGR